MRYAQIRSMDISNGANIGVSIFIQGCHFHCNGCFNQETWDFNGGYEWTDSVKQRFLKLLKPSYIKRCSILGGEPLALENVSDVLDLVRTIKNNYPSIHIWLYTGFNFNNLTDKRQQCVLKYCDVLVDGQYMKDLKSSELLFKGSSNQRVIDVQKTLSQNKIILYEGT